MKKNLIYTLCVMLSATLALSSCEDMLEIETERVDVEFDDLTLSDSVYSVLGILKSVQNIADRTVLLGELRGDLVSANVGKAVYDIQSISDFNFDTGNPYIDARDYYSVINNCNVFLSRVDTTIERNGRNLIGEFVAVKSMRAWAYMQLAINYGNVPYYTEPILTHSQATEVMSRPKKSRDEIFSLLIDELTPIEDPRLFPMPTWKGIETGAPRTAIATEQLFVPVRYLLGELHLWRAMPGDYRTAANYFFKTINETPVNPTSANNRIFVDNSEYVRYSNYDDYDGYVNAYSALYKASTAIKNYTALTVIPMETTTSTGTISYLSDIFMPEVEGAAQVSASPSYVSLSNRQDYLAYISEEKIGPTYNPTSEMYKGDLRRYAITGSQIGENSDDVYNNVIAKLNYGNNVSTNNMHYVTSSGRTNFVQIVRAMHLYARFAEALVGLSKEELCPDALVMAMEALKSGLKRNYELRTHLYYVDREVAVDSLGNPTDVLEDIVDTITVKDPVYNEIIRYNFLATRYEDNEGIHSRGSGNSKHNKYYSLSDTCVARYYDLVKEDSDTLFAPVREITDRDYYRYVNDILLDELALEFCFEGNRFGDLIRFAKRAEKDGYADWKDILARRVAGRDIENKVTYYNKDYVMDNDLYSFLTIENNWYLPLPLSEAENDAESDKDSDKENTEE